VKTLVLTLTLLLGAVSFAAAQAPPTHANRPSGVHYVYLIRHGHYDRDDKAPDDRVANGLSALGHEQARMIGERLAGLGVKIDRLISSELLRAVQTSDDMGKVMKMTPTRDAALNECTPTTNNERMNSEQAPGELAECDSARAVQWERYFQPTPERDTFDVLVCHGNVIRWTIMRAMGADTRGWLALDCGHCSLTIVAVRPDGSIRPVMYSDVGHIPVEKQTWSGRGGGWVKGR